MIKFRILFVLDALIALVVLWQCLLVSMELLPARHAYDVWPLMRAEFLALAICAGSLWAAWTLKTRGRAGLGSLVLLIPAVPALLGLLMLGIVLLAFSMGGAHH